MSQNDFMTLAEVMRENGHKSLSGARTWLCRVGIKSVPGRRGLYLRHRINQARTGTLAKAR